MISEYLQLQPGACRTDWPSWESDASARTWERLAPPRLVDKLGIFLVWWIVHFAGDFCEKWVFERGVLMVSLWWMCG
jgi:hypothetical protein